MSATVRGGTSPYSYSFSGPGTITATGAATATVAGLRPGIQSFTLTARDSGTPTSQSITAVASVTVPGGNLSGSTTLCTGQSASLSVGITSATGPFTLVYNSTTSTTTVSTTVTSFTSGNAIVVSPTVSTTYTLVSLTGSNGAALPVGGLAAVTVNTVPTLTISGIPALCGGSPTTLTATGGSSYALAGASGASQSNTTGIFTISQVGSYTITATNGGCSRPLSFSVESTSALPNATLTALGSNTVLTCNTTSVSLVASAGGTNYTFLGPGINQSGASNQLTVGQPGTYSVLITGQNGCTATVTTTVASNTLGPAGNLQANGQLTCTQSVVSLSASGGAPGTNYIFGGNGLLQASPVGSVTVNSPGSYSVIITGENGCRVVLSTNVVSNTAAPQVSLIAAGPLTCQTNTVLVVATPGGRDYVFSGPNIFQATSANSLTARAAGVYSVLMTAENGCTGIASTTVTFSANTASATLRALNTLTCSATSATLVGSGTGTTFSFTGPGISQFGSATSIVVSQPGTYFLSVTGGTPGCSATAVATVSSVTIAPTVSVNTSGTLGCSPGSVTLTTVQQNYNFTFTGPGGYSTTNTSGIAVVSQAGAYTLVTKDPLTGCSSSQIISVTSSCQSTTTAPPSSSGPLTLVAPVYNCQTGAITLQTVAGDGSPITFFTPGINRPSAQSPTGTVEAGLRFDPKPITIQATQSGVTVSYIFDLVAYCGRGRFATTESLPRFTVTILGNPVSTDWVSVEVHGAAGQSLHYQITDMNGRVLTEKQVTEAPGTDRQTLRIGSDALYLLRVRSPQQSETLKIVRQ